MRMPTPSLAEMNSPTTAPISASAIAVFSPAMMIGNELGSISFQKTCRLVAPSERNISSASGSTLRRPVSVFTKGAKKHTSAAIAILELQPKPNHAIINGATAISGVTCTTTT